MHVDQQDRYWIAKRVGELAEVLIEHGEMPTVSLEGWTLAVVSLNFTLIRRLYTCQFSTFRRSVIDSERRRSQLVRIPVSSRLRNLKDGEVRAPYDLSLDLDL